jgi:KDO2-lipid IV(A) lauroyltransferase
LESYLVYLMCRAVLVAFAALPRDAAGALVDALAAITYRLDRRHREIALVNLTVAFPMMSEAERERIARRSFQNTGRNLLEVSRMHRLNSGNISTLVAYDECCGMNNFNAARATGKPLLYMTGHFSAWELLPTAHALYGQPLSFITRPLDNLYLERHLVKIRERSGNRVISKKNSARQILENLKAFRPIGILVDQNTSLQEGVFADFFGVPAATSSSLALFGLRRDAVILPGYLTPARRGRYLIKFLPPVDLIRTGDMARDIQLNTDHFNRILEGIIREQPESWLWGHKRWKLQPDGRDLYSMSRPQLQRFLASRPPKSRQ